MEIANEGVNLPQKDLFFVATANYLGNKRSAYMHNISFSLATNLPEPGVNQTLDLTPIDSNLGDVILENNFVNFKLVLKLPEPPGTNITYYTVRFRSIRIRLVSTVN